MTEIREQNLPEDADSRSQYPLDDGLFGYFAAALLEVAKVSKIGNDQHNPGQPMHWDRAKSRDHGNKIMRHQLDAGKIDLVDGTRHSAKVAWRALAQLQEELEREGAPIARNARNADTHDHLKKLGRIGQFDAFSELSGSLGEKDALRLAREIGEAAKMVAAGDITLDDAKRQLYRISRAPTRKQSRVG